MNAAGQLSYSLAGYVNDSNEFTEIWFITEGTLTVAEEGVMTLNALNSNGKK